MSILNKRSFLQDDEINTNKKQYRLPTLVLTKPESMSVAKSATIATALHPLTVGLIWLISIVLALMGINLSLFKKAPLKPKQDIEFVLVDKPAPPKNPNTKNRADMNSRTGGINDPKRKVSMPTPKAQEQKKTSTSTNVANKLIQKQREQVKQQAKQQTVKKTQPTPQPKPQQVISNAPQQTQTTVNKPSPAKPAAPSPRPSANPLSSLPTVSKPSSPFSTPAPSGAPVGKTLSTGPVGGTSSAGTAKSGSTTGGAPTGAKSGTGAPRPTLAPTSSGSGGSLSRGSSGGSGNVGNPGGGGGTPGIDALREPDFGPYMRELQNRIKMNWDPPKGNESKTVVLMFKIAKDGRLLSCSVSRSSGLPIADQAALNAVKLTAPFRPLPADFKGQSIDIQFTFDYRVFGARRY